MIGPLKKNLEENQNQLAVRQVLTPTPPRLSGAFRQSQAQSSPTASGGDFFLDSTLELLPNSFSLIERCCWTCFIFSHAG
jgi:hypothetical protein